ncbi:uncharacterized protein LOC109853802 [Pseudomyrmex gracilis]|uniref:uncharacterized protein LOC109853802 n=1 Tax=Pseudomyrmex gracilis TaxID=219809 RepID=UPI0009954560|nr:uncharacterized protein LOC109853802 [Pseudomyrmex gracilis]
MAKREFLRSTMMSQLSKASIHFTILRRFVCWLWETIEHILLILLDFVTRLIELILVVTNLLFQIICFFRDLCIDALQTFANIFRGIVNVISSISCEEVEDFASACIVVILCTGAVKMLTNFLKKNPHAKLFNVLGQHVTQSGSNNNTTARNHGQDTCPPAKKTSRRVKRRNNRRYRNVRKN